MTNKELKDTWIYLSDDGIFSTLEGEGRYIGYPSIFLRSSLCNLTCRGFASKDSPNGCDSYISWSVKNKTTFGEIASFMEANNYHEKLKNGAIFKLTGGEPLIWESKLLKLCDFLCDRWGFTNSESQWNTTTHRFLQIDFETNGTIKPSDIWIDKFKASFTVSPKLSSNGDPIEKRYNPEALKWLVYKNACFKFVISSEKDVQEVFDCYVNNSFIKVPLDQIWFMPCRGSRQELIDKGPMVAELCKKYNVKFSNRMHLQIWDKALKV